LAFPDIGILAHTVEPLSYLIQDVGFSKHWNYAHTVETPLNDHSKFEKVVAAYGKWLLMRVGQQGVVYEAFLEDLRFLGGLL